MNSLKYVISGSRQGELIVWLNGQIKKQITLKVELTQLLTVPRPSNHKLSQTLVKTKTPLPRIKALHKYYQKDNDS
jgi:hypothetical protein